VIAAVLGFSQRCCIFPPFWEDAGLTLFLIHTTARRGQKRREEDRRMAKRIIKDKRGIFGQERMKFKCRRTERGYNAQVRRIERG
jgi:hypothetical protein